MRTVLASTGQLLLLTTIVASTLVIPSLAQERGQQEISNQREQRIREHEMQMKNVDSERVRSQSPQATLAQVNEDFGRLKAINIEGISTSAVSGQLDYQAVAQTAEEIKKRATRLKTNLALPTPSKDEKPEKGQDKVDDTGLKLSLASLKEMIRSFADNPIFKPSAVIDSQLAAKARRDLEAIIDLSEKVKRTAEKLSKSASKSS